MSLIDLAEFRSDQFAPFLPDDSQVNPGVFGAELAYWLSRKLAGKGVVTSYPEYEDWGWYIEYITLSGSEFAVHCYNINGSNDKWLLAVRRHPRKLFGRDKPAWSEAAQMIEAIRTVLAEDPGVTNLKWLYSDGAA